MDEERIHSAAAASLSSASLAISQDQINRYAQLSSDFNPLHVDPDFASRTMFGGTIAHGTIAAACIFDALSAVTGGPWLKGVRVAVKFIGPARPGDTVHAQGTLVPQDGDQLTYEISCEDQRGQQIIVGTAEFPI